MTFHNINVYLLEKSFFYFSEDKKEREQITSTF